MLMDAPHSTPADTISRPLLAESANPQRLQPGSQTSPLIRFPPELLGEIFLFTLPSDRTIVLHGRLNVHDSPWILGHICREWRAVALALPSLWSFVAIDYSFLKPKASELYPVSMLKTQLQRAGKLRIHINDPGPNPRALELLEVLVDESLRWEELNLSVVGSSDALPIIARVHNRLPLLGKLWLTSTEMGQQAIDCFEDAPQLRDVSLVSFNGLAPMLPVQQLTRYDLSADWNVHVRFLKLATHVVEARIFVLDPKTPRVVPGGVVELPRLLHLFVSDVDMLDCLKLPILEDLRVRNDGYFDIVPHVHSLISRSSCALRKLCVLGLPIALAVVEILTSHPSIVELAVSVNATRCQISPTTQANTLLAELTKSTPSPSLEAIPAVTPHLREVSIGCDDGLAIDYRLYTDMLETRFRARQHPNDGAALSSATLFIGPLCPLPSPTTLARMESLRNDGLNLRMLHGSEAMVAMNLELAGSTFLF